jgi:hypothetical protein
MTCEGTAKRRKDEEQGTTYADEEAVKGGGTTHAEVRAGGRCMARLGGGGVA